MMKTSAADVSFYITNAVNTVDKNPQADSKQSDSMSFASFMNTSAGKSDNFVNENLNKTKTTVEKPGRKDLDNQKNTAEKVSNKDTDNNGKTVNSDEKKVDSAEDTVNTKAEEIKDSIKEKLADDVPNIDDEMIENAMELLNLTLVDLLDPDNLKDLMMSLTGQEDTVSLLTNEELYTDMMDITNLVSDISDEIKKELSLTDEEFNDLISDMKMTDETKEVTGEFEEKVMTPELAESSKEEKNNNPNIKVEINVSEEMRTSDPKILMVTGDNNAKQTQNWQDFNNNESNEEMQQMPQQVVQNETVTVSDAVETVRQFTSYTNGNEVVNQVTEFIKVNISPETTSMELQLHPASLGTVNLNIVSQNGNVTAQLLVQTESVKEALEAQMAQLQEVFDEQGTKVEAVEVAVASYDLDRGPFQDRDDRQDRQNADKQNTHKKINLNLNDLSDEDISNLDEDDQLARHVMEMNGTSIDFSA